MMICIFLKVQHTCCKVISHNNVTVSQTSKLFKYVCVMTALLSKCNVTQEISDRSGHDRVIMKHLTDRRLCNTLKTGSTTLLVISFIYYPNHKKKQGAELWVIKPNMFWICAQVKTTTSKVQQLSVTVRSTGRETLEVHVFHMAAVD